MTQINKFFSKLYDRVQDKARREFGLNKKPPENFTSLSYSQEGEDRVLHRFFETKVDKGFYVDIGAHHPQRFSNTCLFYERGWSGINIDATPGSMELFKKLRPRDINLELGITKNESELTFFMFNEPALNTFSESMAQSRAELPDYKIIERKKVKTLPLSSVLERYLPQGQVIDFMSLDVEGYDQEVLESNDWSRFRPTVLITESLGVNLSNYRGSDLEKLLTPHGYELFAKTFHSMFFALKGSGH